MPIPNHVLTTARQDRQDPRVRDYFRGVLAEAGVPPDTSPADYPEAVWTAFKALRDARFAGQDTDYSGAGLKKIFRSAGIE